MERRRFLGLAGAAALAPTAPSALLRRSPVSPEGGEAVVEPPPARHPQEDPRVAELYRLIEAKMAEHRVPGVGFALLTDRGLWQTGFGVTNLDNPQPVTPETVFPIASISKTAVATAVMRLVERGRVALDAPVREYVPDFRLADEDAAREVRVRHLLTHTPGWEGQLGTPDRGSRTLEDFTRGLADLPQLARPGEVWSYNNAGFGVAGRVIEVLTDSTIGRALADLVFEPLGLPHAFSDTGTAMTHRFAAPHGDRDRGTVVRRPFGLPANVSAGGVAMSVGSLIRYARLHLGRPVPGVDEPFLTPASIAAMRTPQITKEPTTDEMGAGWHLRTLGGVLTAAHGGTLGGHCLHVQLVPDRDFAFAILTNHNQGWRLIHDAEPWILDTFLGLGLAHGQLTGGNRGGNEMMTTHATALDEQPPYDEYVGAYHRPPSGTAEVRVDGGRLVVSGGGAGGEPARLLFWGADVTYTEPAPGSTYPYRGMPVEFVRDDAGAVRWIRINGRIARKE